MRQILCFSQALAAMIALMISAGCSSPRDLVFANREWHIRDHYSQIIDKDTTYRMTFGDILMWETPTIVSSSDSVACYPGMDRFMEDILHTVHLDGAEILFYVPQMQTMFVRAPDKTPPMRPFSISVRMDEEQPYTLWVNEDDMEDWTRKSDEMYTYTYFDKGKKRILIVDFYDYGDTPVAQITIFQSRSKATSKMKVPENIRRAFWYRDLKYFTRDIEFWSHQVESHRKNAFANYRIGQEQKLRNR